MIEHRISKDLVGRSLPSNDAFEFCDRHTDEHIKERTQASSGSIETVRVDNCRMKLKLEMVHQV